MSISPIKPLNNALAVAVPQPAVEPVQAAAQVVQPAPEAVKTALSNERDALEQALEALAKGVRAWSTHLQFEIDEDSGRVVVRVIDTDSGETVRQIPAEEALRLAREGGDIRDLAFHTRG